MKNENITKLISRHEVTANLEDFISVSAKLLKDKKALYMVHRPERLVDIKFVQPNQNKEPNLVLIKAIKNAQPFLKMEKTLFVYKENGEYTNEILKIYGKEK